MSLVHQALQKAEREKQRRALASSPAPVSAALPPTPPATPAQPVVHSASDNNPIPTAPATPSVLPWFWPVMILVGMLALAFVSIVAIFVWSTFQPRPPIASSPPTVDSSVLAGPPAPKPAAPSPTVIPSEQRWKLTGISKGPDGRYFAIINGYLRGESEYVDGAIVHVIERDRVILRVNGEELVLRLY